MDLRWNNLSSEEEILSAIKQSDNLLEIKLKGNKFSSSFYESVDLQIQSNELKIESITKNNLEELKKLVELSSKTFSKTLSSNKLIF